jgi:hypothetical protein
MKRTTWIAASGVLWTLACSSTSVETATGAGGSTATTTSHAGGSTTTHSGGGGSGNAGGGSGNSGGGNCCDSCNGPSCTASLECFCSTYPCTPGAGPFGGAPTDGWILDFADCSRRLYVGFEENPEIWHLVDTTSDTLVGAQYADDSGICNGDAQLLHAGEAFDYDSVPGCTLSGCQPIGSWTCPPS